MSPVLSTLIEGSPFGVQHTNNNNIMSLTITIDSLAAMVIVGIVIIVPLIASLFRK